MSIDLIRLRTLILLAAAGYLLTTTFAQGALTSWLSRDIARDEGVTSSLTDARGSRLTMLAVMVDSAGDLPHPRNRRADGILVITKDRSTTRTTALSVPRDLLVDHPELGQITLSEMLGYSGRSGLAKAVSEAIGGDIHAYLEIEYEAFTTIVDAVGGLDISLCSPLYDPLSQLSLPSGDTHLTGAGALAILRSRELMRASDSSSGGQPARWTVESTDSERVVRAQLLLLKLMTQLADGLSLVPIIRMSAIRDKVTVDSRFDFQAWLNAAISTEPTAIDFESMNVATTHAPGSPFLPGLLGIRPQTHSVAPPSDLDAQHSDAKTKSRPTDESCL